MTYECKRLVSIKDILVYWPFFRDGLESASKYLRYSHSIETLRKIIFDLVNRHSSAWVGIVLVEGIPVGFGLAHECTPLFSQDREFEVSLFYHQPGNDEATCQLQHFFETFCKENNIYRYYATTRRDSGAAIRCFQAPKYGFKRAYTVFVKSLDN